MKYQTVDGEVRLSGKRCLCRGCNRAFSTEANFTKHRSKGFKCRHPEDAGMVLDERTNLWKLPSSPDYDLRSRRLAPAGA